MIKSPTRLVTSLIHSRYIQYDISLCFSDPVQMVCLSVSNLTKSLSKCTLPHVVCQPASWSCPPDIDYWNTLLGMKVYSQTDSKATLGYADNQVPFSLVTNVEGCVCGGGGGGGGRGEGLGWS